MQRCPHCGRTLVGQREDHPELCELQLRLAARRPVTLEISPGDPGLQLQKLAPDFFVLMNPVRWRADVASA